MNTTQKWKKKKEVFILIKILLKKEQLLSENIKQRKN